MHVTKSVFRQKYHISHSETWFLQTIRIAHNRAITLNFRIDDSLK